VTQQKVDSLPKTKQADFQIGYIWVALATAIFSGFAIGGHLAFVIGYNLPLGKGFLSFIQAHGHVQLVGWAGLFIIGMSLYFIPRLSSVPISQPQLIQLLPWLIAIGLLLRSVGHTTLPYIRGSVFFVPLNWVVAFSGLIEWYGILLYVSLLLGTIVGIQNARVRPALMSVRPYFCMMVAGFFLYTSINLVLLIQMALSKEIVVNQAWNEFAIHVFIGLVLLPVSLAFSVRTFPLYLRLPATDWHVRSTAYFYLFSFLLQVVPTAPLHFGRTAFYLSSLGMLLKGGVIFWMVWKLDSLTRLQEPWTTQRALQPGPHRRPTRPGIPDYGEFGRFERLVYAAYAWLILGAFLEMLIGGSTLLGILFQSVPMLCVTPIYWDSSPISSWGCPCG